MRVIRSGGVGAAAKLVIKDLTFKEVLASAINLNITYSQWNTVYT
jgi:hypothetical protein